MLSTPIYNISYFRFLIQTIGSSLMLRANGLGGSSATVLAAHFAKQNTKFGGGGKRGRAKIPSPQPPSFLPARAFRFCAPQPAGQSFLILFKKYSNFVQKTPPNKKSSQLFGRIFLFYFVVVVAGAVAVAAC